MPDRRVFLSSAALLTTGARANAWPTRPVRLIVAYPPGGLSDETARGLGRALSLEWGVPVVVENRAGAGGAAAMTELARAAPDGYTLCWCAISPLVYAPLLGPLGYDPERDVAPVVAVMHTPVLVLAHPAFKPATLAEVVAHARAAPGSVRWATSGLATVGHMVLEQVRLASGADITHVPYKGGGQQLNDALGGQFELLSSNVADLQLQYVRQGRLKALAVGAPQRVSALPSVPTLAEAGFAAANLESTFGLFAPRGTPAAVVGRINRDLNALLQQPELRTRLAAANNRIGGGSAADFSQQIAAARTASARLLERAPR